MNGRNWIGLLFILFGIGFILQQTDILDLQLFYPPGGL